MPSRILTLMFAAVLWQEISFASDAAQQRCGTRVDVPASRVHQVNETGGIHITASGVLRVLLVFASFPDDETPHPFWPAHQPPLSMNQFLDPDTSTRSQGAFNLTNFFRQMSLGRFHVVGEALWVESRHPSSEYLNGAYWKANKHVLEERVDSLVDFSLYDHWTNHSPFHNSESPDGQVDMILMVWRTTLFQFFGEASLGYHEGFVLDGKRIEMGFPEYIPFPRGSGVTCLYVYTDSPRQIMQTMVHELSHWLLGGPHPYNNDSPDNKHAYWGMLCSGLRNASCVNAYERERLDWKTVPELQPGTTTILRDYLTSGDAWKYHPSNGEPFEYFYIENHQRLSLFDDVTTNPDDRGIWILHQQGPYLELDNLKMAPSDGRWSWLNPGTTMLCGSQPLPVFQKGTPNLPTGATHRDQIPIPTSRVNWLLAYRDSAQQIHCGFFPNGQRFTGSFTADANPLFSPYSNPNTNTWSNQPTPLSLEVVSDSAGSLTLRFAATPLDAAPAKRFLGVNPMAAGLPPGTLALAWGAQWSTGQPLEPDVDFSELQRAVGVGSTWETVYQGSTTAWSDASLYYDTSGTIPVRFRARVRDTQGKFSAWSDVFFTHSRPSNGVVEHSDAKPSHYELRANYPNPFNPSTIITFALPAPENVTLVLYHILGCEVKTVLRNEHFGPGVHSVLVHAHDLPSGVYFYRMITPHFTLTRKMCLTR